MRLFFFLGLLAAGMALSVFLFSGCGTGTPTSAGLKTPTATYTPYGYGFGTVSVNDVATGTCPIHVWLDSVGPVTISGVTVLSYPNIPVGAHNLTFNATDNVVCGSPATCLFNNGGTFLTGYSCAFYVQANHTSTASITDDGCSRLYVTCPY